METETFVLIGQYQYSTEALIYKGKLESEAIEVFIRDNNFVDTNPLYSNAVGGVKLYVNYKDLEYAKAILLKINKYSLDDNHNLIQCPNCGAEQIQMVTSIKDWKTLFSLMISFLFILFPFYVKHKYKCDNCKFEFN